MRTSPAPKHKNSSPCSPRQSPPPAGARGTRPGNPDESGRPRRIRCFGQGVTSSSAAIGASPVSTRAVTRASRPSESSTTSPGLRFGAGCSKRAELVAGRVVEAVDRHLVEWWHALRRRGPMRALGVDAHQERATAGTVALMGKNWRMGLHLISAPRRHSLSLDRGSAAEPSRRSSRSRGPRSFLSCPHP